MILSKDRSLIDKTSEKLDISPSIISEVVDFQWKYTFKGFHHNNSVEIGGFGRFTVQIPKLLKLLNKYHIIMDYLKTNLKNPDLTETKRRNILDKIDSFLQNILLLEGKLPDESFRKYIRQYDKYKGNSGGVEKPLDTSNQP